MKTNSWIVTSVALALVAATPLHSQDVAEPVQTPPQQTARAAEAAAKKAEADEQKARADAQQQETDRVLQKLMRARQDQDQQRTDQSRATGGGGAAGAFGGSGFGGASGGSFGGSASQSGPNRFSERLSIIRRATPGPARTLLVRSSPADPKAQANLEEDLAVMSHLLDKATGEKSGADRGPTAMGIDVFFAPGSSSIRDLYLEGYGALFLVNVGFPLLPDARKTDEQKAPTDSTWEEARRELYGQSGPGGVSGQSVPYDEEKVNRLKDAILESLKNAANIRDLNPDDSITVCVFGTPAAGPVRPKPATLRRNETTPFGQPEERVRVWDAATGQPVDSPARHSVLTVRVTKSDVDALAKGNLTPDLFRNKAKISTYTGTAGGGGFGIGGFGASGGGFGGGAAGQTR